MPSAFRRIADELDPTYVPEWAARSRRPVPRIAAPLLSFFGTYWLPRIGLLLVAIALGLEIGAGFALVATQWALAVILFVAAVATVGAGFTMWTSYRMRHWLPGGAGASAPIAPPGPRISWFWLGLGVADLLTGTALMLWLLTPHRPSVRAVVFAVGIFALCAGTGSAILAKEVKRLTRGELRLSGSRVVLIAGIVIAITEFAQLPFLSGPLFPTR